MIFTDDFKIQLLLADFSQNYKITVSEATLYLVQYVSWQLHKEFEYYMDFIFIILFTLLITTLP